MLGKLFKHEMKATARLLMPIYLILAVLTVMDRVVLYLDIFKGVLALIPGFITFAYVLSLIAIVMVSAVIIIIRFYKNLMTDEGYLMFTLPVKSHELINSKLIASFIWTIASMAAVVVSIMIVCSGAVSFQEVMDGFRDVLRELDAQFGSFMTLFIIEMVIMMFVGSIYGILMIYVSIAVGQLFNGHKVLGSFAAYIGISTVIQIITTVGTLLLSWIFQNTLLDIDSIPKIIFPLFIFYFLVQSAAFYFVTDYIFRKKVNLD